MKKLSEYYGEKIKLVQPNFGKRYYELRTEKELLCTMRFPKLFSTAAEVDCGESNLIIKKEKWWGCSLIVLQSGVENPLAKVRIKFFNHSIVELANGEIVLLKFGFFSFKTIIMSELENPIATLKRKCSFKDEVDVQMEYGVKQLDNYPWILMLALYIDLSRRRRQSATR